MPFTWRDELTGDIFDLPYVPSSRDELEEMLKPLRAQKTMGVAPDVGTAARLAVEEKGKEALGAVGRGIDWFANSAVLEPLAVAVRDPTVRSTLRATVPGFTGLEAATGLPAAGGALIGAGWDTPLGDVPDLKEIVRAEAEQGLPTALEQVAPVDVATLGLGLAAKGASTVPRLARFVPPLVKAARASDILESAVGGEQLIEGAATGSPLEAGMGLARLAGGAAGFLPEKPRIREEIPVREGEIPDVTDLGEVVPPDIEEGRAAEPGERKSYGIYDDPKFQARGRILNMYNGLMERIGPRAAEITGEAEIPDLRVREGMAGSEYQGKRAMTPGVGNKNRGLVDIDFGTVVSRSRNIEEFARVLRNTLLHEISHTAGLHTFPRVSLEGELRFGGPGKTSFFEPDYTVEPPDFGRGYDAARRRGEYDLTEEGRQYSVQEQLAHDPEVLKYLDQFEQNIINNPDIWQTLKGERPDVHGFQYEEGRVYPTSKAYNEASKMVAANERAVEMGLAPEHMPEILGHRKVRDPGEWPNLDEDLKAKYDSSTDPTERDGILREQGLRNQVTARTTPTHTEVPKEGGVTPEDLTRSAELKIQGEQLRKLIAEKGDNVTNEDIESIIGETLATTTKLPRHAAERAARWSEMQSDALERGVTLEPTGLSPVPPYPEGAVTMMRPKVPLAQRRGIEQALGNVVNTFEDVTTPKVDIEALREGTSPLETGTPLSRSEGVQPDTVEGILDEALGSRSEAVQGVQRAVQPGVPPGEAGGAAPLSKPPEEPYDPFKALDELAKQPHTPQPRQWRGGTVEPESTLGEVGPLVEPNPYDKRTTAELHQNLNELDKALRHPELTAEQQVDLEEQLGLVRTALENKTKTVLGQPTGKPPEPKHVTLAQEDQGYTYHSTDRVTNLEGILKEGLKEGHVSNVKGQGTGGPYTIVYEGKQPGLTEVAHRPGDFMGKVEGKPKAIIVDPDAFVPSDPVEKLRVRAEETSTRLDDYIASEYKDLPKRKITREQWDKELGVTTKYGDPNEIVEVIDYENMDPKLKDRYLNDRKLKNLERLNEEAQDRYLSAADNPEYKPKTNEDYYLEAKAIGDKYGVPVIRAKVDAEGDITIPEGALKGLAPEVTTTPKTPALEAKEGGKGQSFAQFMQEKFGDKTTTSRERALAKAEWNKIREERRTLKLAESAGIPPEKLRALMGESTGEKPSAGSLSRWRRAAMPVIENFEVVHPWLKEKFVKYIGDAETPAMKNIADSYRIKKTLSKTDERYVIDILDGKKGIDASTPANVRTAAIHYRAMLDQAWSDAIAAGVRKAADRKRQSYFPHKFAEGWDDNLVQNLYMDKNWNLRESNLEKARLSKRADYRRDLDVLDEYFLSAYRRISEVSNFGKRLQVLRQFAKKHVADKATAEWLQTNIRRVMGREHPGGFERFAGHARHVQALTDLGLAGFYQPIQAANTALYGGLGRSIRALQVIAKDAPNEVYDAIRSRALVPDITQEIVAGAYGSREGIPTRALQKFMYGIPTIDRWTRIHANTVGKLMVSDALKGSRGAIKDIRALGFNEISDLASLKKVMDTDPDFGMKVGKELSDKALFRSGAMELPGWTSSTAGKLATQYTRFMYRHSLFLRDIFTSAAKGNVRPLARFLTVAPLVVNGMAELLYPIREGLREAIKQGVNQEYDPERIAAEAKGDESTWDDEIQWYHVLRNKRIPWTHPLKRALQNASMWGGIGVFQMALERIMGASGSPVEVGTKALAGPVAGNVYEGAGALIKDINRLPEDYEWDQFPFRNTRRWGVQQIPIMGYPAAKKMREELGE